MKRYILLRSVTTASNFYNDRFSRDTKELFICFGLWWNVVKHPSEKSQFGTKVKKKISYLGNFLHPHEWNHSYFYLSYFFFFLALSVWPRKINLMEIERKTSITKNEK